jgi:hypothetical protein
LVSYAADWAWSSVRAHITGKDDGLVTEFRGQTDLTL